MVSVWDRKAARTYETEAGVGPKQVVCPKWRQSSSFSIFVSPFFLLSCSCPTSASCLHSFFLSLSLSFSLCVAISRSFCILFSPSASSFLFQENPFISLSSFTLFCISQPSLSLARAHDPILPPSSGRVVSAMVTEINNLERRKNILPH